LGWNLTQNHGGNGGQNSLVNGCEQQVQLTDLDMYLFEHKANIQTFVTMLAWETGIAVVVESALFVVSVLYG